MFQKYIDQKKDQIETRTCNLTRDQITALEGFSKALGVSFEDVVLLLIEASLIDVQDSFLTQLAQQQTIKN